MRDNSDSMLHVIRRACGMLHAIRRACISCIVQLLMHGTMRGQAPQQACARSDRRAQLGEERFCAERLLRKRGFLGTPGSALC